MLIGIYGGSFNPIHYGHLGVSRWVLEHTDLDELWLMPSPQNPLKQEADLEDANSRLEGARKAVDGLIKEHPNLQNRLIVSDFEFGLPKPTYTAATLRALGKQYPEHTFSLLIGADNVACWDRWREHEWILKNYRIFVFPRELDNLEIPENLEKSTTASIGFRYLKDAPLFDISSTQIRGAKGQK